MLGKVRTVDKADGYGIAKEDGVGSELFIARVIRVEKPSTNDEDGDDMRKLPLLYHRRGYTTTRHDGPLDHQPFNPKLKF